MEPPYTERYVRWCERSAIQLMDSLLLDLGKEKGQRSNLNEVKASALRCISVISFYRANLNHPLNGWFVINL